MTSIHDLKHGGLELQPAEAPESAAAPAVAMIEGRDLALLVQLALVAPISWLVTEHHWLAVSHWLASLRALWRRDRHARTGKVEALLQDRTTSAAAQDMVAAQDAYLLLDRLQLLRMYRPGGWQPEIRLQGSAHIDAALAAGNGAILWVVPFAFQRLVTKMAVAQAGYRVTHLSRYFHGFNTHTRFGQRWLNPIRTKQEERYLARRLVIGPEGVKDLFAELAALLRGNELVSITVGHQGRRTCTVPFFAGELKLATGPAFLSYKTGAPLLPVFTVRHADGSFTTSIDAPLADRSDLGAERYIETTAMSFATLLEQMALAHPQQYFGAW